MLVYNYHNDTKEYLYAEEAYINPLATIESGTTKYFIPENATTIEPPKTTNGYVAVFTNDAWEIQKDYRGMHQMEPTGYISTVDYIGDIKDGFVLLTEEQYQKLLEEPEYYIIQNGILIVNPKMEDIEKERLAKTYMTKWDFVKYILNPHGFTYAMLKEVLAKDIQLEEAWSCCSYVYRGDDTLCTNLPKLLPTVTTEFLDEAFRNYGTYGG